MDHRHEQGLDAAHVYKLKDGAYSFLNSCRRDDGTYGLTPISDSSPYTLCFALFLFQLLGRLEDIEPEYENYSEQLIRGLTDYVDQRSSTIDLQTDKAFLQLFAFSLSALYLLGGLNKRPLSDLVETFLPKNMNSYLRRIRAFDGVPQSGNLAMCMGVLAIYACDYLGMPKEKLIEEWVDGHIANMNQFGFWSGKSVTHLQFQNGYHQYEVLEYLGISNPKIDNAVQYVHQIADRRGQFAPYFGGNACYDYDAVSIITYGHHELSDQDVSLLHRNSKTIISERNIDGGFSESQWIRPRSLKTISQGMHHALSVKGTVRKERAKYLVAMLSPKHDRVHTHWTKYSREWGESNLWDTWFRLLTLARIDIALNPEHGSRWGFIDFPGIGFHPSLRQKQSKLP